MDEVVVGFTGGLGAGPDATSVIELAAEAGAGARLLCVVFDRPRDSEDTGDFGDRWDVDLSRPGVNAAGGVGAGRKEVGAEAGIDFVTGGKDFVGGGGAARWNGNVKLRIAYIEIQGYLPDSAARYWYLCPYPMCPSCPIHHHVPPDKT